MVPRCAAVLLTVGRSGEVQYYLRVDPQANQQNAGQNAKTSLSLYIYLKNVCVYIYMYGTPPPIHTLCAFYTVNYSVFVIFWTNFFE